jgi:N-acetylglucosamine-6-phosphate deacetylase
MNSLKGGVVPRVGLQYITVGRAQEIDALLRDVEIIADGCHIPPTLLKYVLKFKKPERIALVTDAMRAAGQNVTESFLGSPDDPQPVIVEDGVAKLTDRTAFAGSVATGDRLVKTMVSCGASISDAVKMVTENPLRMMGLSVKKGKLLPGWDADLCVFDENIQIRSVFADGEKN